MVSSRAALALGALLAAGCERASPPSAAATPPAAETPAAETQTAPATAGDPFPRAATFDVGEIKSAAEYLREPQFAAAELKRGQLLSLACAACHSFGAGEKTIVGPNLHGVFGRPAAAVEGFEYSPGLRSSGIVWTPRALDAWLADPASFVAGTKMTFTGYRSAEDRRDLIAYLLQATQ
jgi:cytochrome c